MNAILVLRFAKLEATTFPFILCITKRKLKISDNNLKLIYEVLF